MSANKSVKFQIKLQTVAEKTAKNFRGLLYFATFCRSNLPFLISGIWPLWHSAPSARVHECQKLKNGRLGLYGTEHLKCNHTMTLGLKG